MNFKRIGRVLVCLLLVFCLIVNVSPIRTEAVSLSVMGTAVSVVAWDVLAAAFIGCGIAAAADRTDFDAVVDAAEDYYKSVGVIDSNGAMDVYSIQNAGFDYGVPLDFLQASFDWLYDEEVLTSDSASFAPTLVNEITYKQTCYGANVTYTSSSITFCVYGFDYIDAEGVSFGANIFLGSKYGSIVASTSSSNISFLNPSSYEGYRVSIQSQAGLSACDFDTPYIGSFVFSEDMDSQAKVSMVCDRLFGMPQTSLDVTLNRVASAGSTVAEGYADWYSRSVTIQDENGDDIQVVPIGSASTGTVAGTYTQGDVWTGSAPTIIVIEDSNTGDAGTTTPDVDPNPDVTPDTDALTQAGFDASLATFLASLGTKLAEWFDKQFGILDAICSCVESIYGYVESIAEFIASILTLFEPVAEWFEALITGQTTIIDSIIALPGAIGDIFENIIGAAVDVLLVGIEAIFVPSEDFLTVKVESIRARFEIADSIMATGETIRGMLTSLGGEPPVIYIHLEDSESSYDYGGTVPILDMRWYERYKPTGDKLLSSLIWLFFAWRCFVHAPNIISGIAGNIEAFNFPSDGVYTKDSGGLLGGNSWLGTWNEYQRGKYESKRKSRR